MATIQVCKDTSEAVELCESRGLYLKPLARLNVCVQLPLMKTPGKSISSWEVMEKLRKMIVPDEFSSLKVIKTTLEFIRFEGEVENKTILKVILSRIENHSTMKLAGFTEVLKVKAAEAKLVFPGRYDWDSFFRDAKNMNEMKPGERPDTVHFQDLPTKWFADKHQQDPDRPSEKVLRQVFETFGEIRCCDIPMLDRHRKDMHKAVGGIQTFSFNQDLTFEAYIQFKEYVGFVKAMDALRGMKLVHKSGDGKVHVVMMKIDFDKSKHLSDKNIRKRRLERENLVNLEKMKEDRVHKERVEEETKREASRKRQIEAEKERRKRKEEKMRRKDERRKMKTRARKAQKEEERRIFQQALARRRELLQNRRAQATLLLQDLFKMVRVSEIKLRKEEIKRERKKQEDLEERRRLEEERAKEQKLQRQEQALRERLLLNLKSREEKRTEELREKLRKELAGRNVLKSVLVTTPEAEMQKSKVLYRNGEASSDYVVKRMCKHKIAKIFRPYFQKPYHRHNKRPI